MSEDNHDIKPKDIVNNQKNVNISRHRSVFEWIGILASIITVIWLSIQLYNYAFPKTHNLEAHGDFFEYYIPDSIKKEIANTNNNELCSLFDPLYEFRHMFIFLIRNDTEKEITNIVLEVPFEGLFQIIRDDKTISSLIYNKKVPLGSLRPANDMKVIAWHGGLSVNLPYGRFNDRYRVTHPDGFSMIEFPVKSRGFVAKIVSIGFFNIFIFIIMGYTIVQLIYLSVSINKSRKKMMRK